MITQLKRIRPMFTASRILRTPLVRRCCTSLCSLAKALSYGGYLLMLTLIVCSASCSSKRDSEIEPAPTTSTPKAEAEKSASVVISNPALTDAALAHIDKALQASVELKKTTAALLAQPLVDNLSASQNAWADAAQAIEALAVFSQLGAGSTSTQKFLLQHQYNLSTWPIQPGYLDTYGEHPYSGLVFDIGMPLSTELLRQQHGLTAESDATLGIYAIEFILFGENNNRGPLLFEPITGLSEQHRTAGYEHIDELPRNRRRQLLQLQTELLVADVEKLQQYWLTEKPQLDDSQLVRAGLALVTQQIEEITDLQNPAASELLQHRLWLSGQLAERLQAQLKGLRSALPLLQMPKRSDLVTATDHTLEHLGAITSASALPAAQPLSLDHAHQQLSGWPLIYQDLRAVAAGLSATSLTADSSKLPDNPAPPNAPIEP